jgi:predicted phage terminase large subunit-like protein
VADPVKLSDVSAAEAAKLILARREARENFLGYAQYMMAEDEQPSLHHRVMAAALDRVEKGASQRIMLLLPPGSAKSTYGSGLFPSFFLGRHPKAQVIAASHTSTFAEKWGRRVRNTVMEKRYENLFPTRIAEDSQAAGQWATKQMGEYFAVGVGAKVQGRRADLMVIDDCFGSREDADSELIRDKVWDWWKFDLMPRLKPGGRVVLINTRYHEDDLAGRILKEEPERWEIIRIPMEAEEGELDALGRVPGERLWKEWFTEEMVEDAKRDPRTWTSLYQQRPTPIGGGELKKSWVQYYDSASFGEMNKIILVDPAGGRKDKKSDFTAIWVIGLGADENVYVLDMVRDRVNMAERTEIIFRLHRKWKPMQVRVERYGLMADAENLRNEMNRRNYRFQLIEVGGSTKKEDRIRRLVPYFMAGRVWFPREFQYTDYSGKQHDLVQKFIEEELAVFPVAAFDDMLDALSRFAEPTLDLPWPKKSEAWAQFPVIDFGVLDPVTNY